MLKINRLRKCNNIQEVPLLQPDHGFCQQNGAERGQVLVSE